MGVLSLKKQAKSGIGEQWTGKTALILTYLLTTNLAFQLAMVRPASLATVHEKIAQQATECAIQYLPPKFLLLSAGMQVIR